MDIGWASIIGLIALYAIIFAIGLPIWHKQTTTRNELIVEYLRKTGQI